MHPCYTVNVVQFQGINYISKVIIDDSVVFPFSLFCVPKAITVNSTADQTQPYAEDDNSLTNCVNE